ncbi:hypothetical protein [Agromyces larvae]|uniref:ABC transporter permease n=1 Tax=Agromyces larvae TaxID=2929802 RepID=A0ABY4C0F3_9MICO|nr:hypothetical protein [Agromyces larvae]UOE44975.1 hypothetical protein MTO99_04120 [Agromyces larvae]
MPAALVSLTIYIARGYTPTPLVMGAGAWATITSLLFVVLTTVMASGIAGTFRRSVTTVLIVCTLITIGPALLNTIRGLALYLLAGAAGVQSPLIVIGNLARFLPWEGANFLDYQTPGRQAEFAATDQAGVLNLSPTAGILITAGWALIALVAWFATDALRAARTH